MKNISFQLNRKLWAVAAMLLCFTLPALAQKVTVHGNVTDDLGEALIGATVMEKGTTNGTSTDIDGNFTLSVAPKATLTVSYVGYDPVDVEVNGRSQINVVMKENATMLAETVVIGYGTVKKSDATGSVAVITPDDIEAGIATSTQDLLVGASPGVVVTTDGGNPTGNATIRIRGGSSLNASNDPLIVIDGMPMTSQSSGIGTNPLTTLNPQDIESMTVLKDASATAIYGSRASNGVILITTKKGRKGRPQVSVAANWHVNTARKTLDLMDGDQYRALALQELGQEEYDNKVLNGQIGSANTNWQKEVLRTSFSQDYSLSVGGTAGFLPYRVNASWADSQGILKESSMQRTTVGFSLNPKFFDDHLSINANAQGSYIATRDANLDAIGSATSFNPTLGVTSPYNTLGIDGFRMYNGYTQALINPSTGDTNNNSPANPVSLLMDRDRRGKSYQSNGNLQIDYSLHFLPELHLNLNLGYEVSQNKVDELNAGNTKSAWENGSLRTNDGIYQPGAATRYDWYELQRNTMLSFYLNYKKEFEAIKSNLDVTAGYDWQRFDYHGRSHTELASFGYDRQFTAATYDANGNLATPATWTVNALDGDQSNGHKAYIGEMIGNESTWSEPLQLVSFYGRINYIFDDTYLLTFTLRDDGTSRFSKDNRWGLFPSLALGWKFVNCKFMEGTRGWWNEGKLRLGWGVTGQQAVGGNYFPYMARYSANTSANHYYPLYGGNASNFVWAEGDQQLYLQAYNPDIKWEETTTWNVGLDLGFFNNRLTVAADWYLRNTKDLIADVNVLGLSTGQTVTQNIGSLRNTGFEITIGAKPVITDDFTWNTSFNMAYNENKITSLGNLVEQPGAIGAPYGTGGNLTMYRVDEPANVFRVYEQVYDKNGDPMPGVFVDQNGDGKIDSQDLISYHDPAPKWTLSWSNTFLYKNWDFGITLRANLGNYVYNNALFDRTSLNRMDRYGMNNMLDNQFLFPTWAVPDDVGYSSYFVENASFLRCDNITAGYTFTDLFGSRLRLRLFAAVQNPFVITKYKGLDPEVSSGYDSNVYPRPFSATIGLVATF